MNNQNFLMKTQTNSLNTKNVPNSPTAPNVQKSQNDPNVSTRSNEIQEYFSYLNSQNNMNLKKIILFYSKYSKVCEQFINSLHPNYKFILTMISVDNSVIRKRLMNSKYKLQYVPCIFMLFDNGKVNVHYGNELISLVTFLNKNMEAFMVIKTNENLAKRNSSQNSQINQEQLGQGRTQLQVSNSIEQTLEQNTMDEIVQNPNRPRITSLNLPQKKVENKMKNLPRIKEPIPDDFKRNMDVGISSKIMIPKGRKEHKKMARTSLTVLETNRQLDTIEEGNDEDEDTSDEEDDINIEMEDGELLDNILEEQEDQTIDPVILKSKTKNKDIKDIAAEMAKERGPIDDKPVIY